MSDDRFTTSDDDLISRLGSLLAEVDSVPESVRAAAVASYSWRSPDTELAQLVDSMSAADVRGDEARLLTFRADSITIEVEIIPIRDRLRIVGQLVPPQPARVQVEQPGSASTSGTDADLLGRFAFDDTSPGPTRLVCTPPGSETVHTEWTTL
ncbi:hypothetical protein HCB17_07575 [Salinispora arenicola]|uniref:hypothetical protein n=1 Tax=Salinispora arenicola TaxID=168697 RepID=UPI00143124A1|nr:hypothetical protein [Salinispora arenicola]NIL41044.1 hypothetical protein [Salinispora arenicola]